jgi:hypothetical protein
MAMGAYHTSQFEIIDSVPDKLDWVERGEDQEYSVRITRPRTNLRDYAGEGRRGAHKAPKTLLLIGNSSLNNMKRSGL